MSAVHTFTQHPYHCRLDRGRHGTRQAASRGDILVIVDTLSFSTAAATAVHHGAAIYPCAREDARNAIAKCIGGNAAVARQDVPARGRFSLSPLTYLNIEPGERIVVASPNGATCSRYARDVPHLLVGALVNAKAVADVLTHLLDTTDRCVTVIACGERWASSTEDGDLRVAIEDDLGAGAIISCLSIDKSPEARACEGAFLHLKDHLIETLRDCGSGRELCEKGFSRDVDHAAQLDLYDTVPVMRGEQLERFR